MKIYPVFIPHAGCPHRCLFCAQDRSAGQSEVPSAKTVFRHLDTMLPSHGKGEIAFYGGSFSLLPIQQQQHYLYVAGHFVSSGRAAAIRISTRPDALDDTCLERLRDAGVRTIEIGCQSFSDLVLDRAGRGHTAEQNCSAARRSRAAGFEVGIQLMPGLPGGDCAEALSSLRRALELEPAFLRIYPTVVIAGTALAQLWHAGAYRPWPLDVTVELCADMLQLCRRQGVPVIRLGLQQDRALQENLLAGPFHPAFGQLVRSRIWRRALVQAVNRGRACSIHPDDLSDVIGHRAENRAWLAANCPDLSVQIDAAVARGSLRQHNRDLPLAELSGAGG